MEQLAVEQAQLLMASNRADNTHSTYAVALEAFKKFCRVYDYDPQILPDTEKVAQFVAYLSWCGYAGSTVQTYLSGLAFYLQSAGAKDVTRNFVIARLVEGCRRRSSRRDTRHPITLSIFSRMLPGLRKKNSYDIFVHGSKCQFIDGINLNLTHVCVSCEIIFVFTYIALVVFVYKVKQKIIIQ